MEDSKVVAAGLAVMARDTGRVLMLQRYNDPKDPAGGTWEFPGGHVEKGETPLQAAKREWSEETGMEVPRGSLQGFWNSGIYRGHVWSIPSEKQLTINQPHEERKLANPDDPDGDKIEAVAWWEPEHLKGNPSMRPELRKAMPVVQRALSRDRYWSKEYARRIGELEKRRSSKTAGYGCPTASIADLLGTRSWQSRLETNQMPSGRDLSDIPAEDDLEACDGSPQAVLRIIILRGGPAKEAATPSFLQDYGRALNSTFNPWADQPMPEVDAVDTYLKWQARSAGATGLAAGAAAAAISGAGPALAVGARGLSAARGLGSAASTGIRGSNTLGGIGQAARTVVSQGKNLAGRVAPAGSPQRGIAKFLGDQLKSYGAWKGFDYLTTPSKPAIPAGVGGVAKAQSAATRYMTPEQWAKFRGPSSSIKRFDGGDL